jgi:hypothetical protein
MLLKVSIASGILPKDLFITGVSIGEDRDPWTSGGFADVFRGTFRGQQVAVKRLRIQNEDKKTVNPVCPFPQGDCNILTYTRWYVGRLCYGNTFSIRISCLFSVLMPRRFPPETHSVWSLLGWTKGHCGSTSLLHYTTTFVNGIGS